MRLSSIWNQAWPMGPAMAPPNAASRSVRCQSYWNGGCSGSCRKMRRTAFTSRPSRVRHSGRVLSSCKLEMDCSRMTDSLRQRHGFSCRCVAI